MTRRTVFLIFLTAVFLQASAYGLTFLLPDLFAEFGANEKDVGVALSLTAVATILTVYYSGHLADWFGRVATLAFACLLIAVSLVLFGSAAVYGIQIIIASLVLGTGSGQTHEIFIQENYGINSPNTGDKRGEFVKSGPDQSPIGIFWPYRPSVQGIGAFMRLPWAQDGA